MRRIGRDESSLRHRRRSRGHGKDDRGGRCPKRLLRAWFALLSSSVLLLRRYVEALDDLLPHRAFGADLLGELIGTVADRARAGIRDAIGDDRLAQRRDDLPVEPRHDLGRRCRPAP